MTGDDRPAPNARRSRDQRRGPSPLAAALSVLRSLLTVQEPGPFGAETVSHSLLDPPLERLDSEGPSALTELRPGLTRYMDQMAAVDPTSLTRTEALAYWINVYNAGALQLAAQASLAGESSVLGIPGGFREPVISAAGEVLGLDDIEHGKLRRFGDPRIHAALVCGSVSCPTLRGEPYRGEILDSQFDDQLRHFLAAGALQVDRQAGVVYLSRVFLWFGADFVRPHRMPSFLPARRSRILASLLPWIDEETAEWVVEAQPEAEFQRYDWGLACTVR